MGKEEVVPCSKMWLITMLYVCPARADSLLKDANRRARHKTKRYNGTVGKASPYCQGYVVANNLRGAHPSAVAWFVPHVFEVRKLI